MDILLEKVKKENIDFEVKQEEVSYELIENKIKQEASSDIIEEHITEDVSFDLIRDENFPINGGKEDILCGSEIKHDDEEKDTNEAVERKMIESIFIKEENDWNQNEESNSDPLAMCPVENESHTTEESCITPADVNHGIPQRIEGWMYNRRVEAAFDTPKKDLTDQLHKKTDLADELINQNAVMIEKVLYDRDEEDVPSTPPKRKKPNPLPSDAKRTTDVGHLPELVTSSHIRHRCRFSGCPSTNARFYCTTCKVHLCITQTRNCYKVFHKM